MKYEKVKYAEKACLLCGKTYIPKRKDSVYCSDLCSTNASKIRRGIQPTVFRKKICLCCGKEFETQYSRKQFCDRKCKGRSQKSQIEKTCVICGKTFLTHWNSQVTCGDEGCKRTHRVNAAKTRYLKSKHTKQPKQPKLIQYETRECKECGELFSIDSRMNNVYCSKDCRRKAENRRSSKRIPKAQRVDNISLKRLYKRDNGICYICGGKCNWNSQKISKNGNPYPGDLYPVIEHVIPISKGGLDAWDNVRLAHWKCNLDKMDGLIDVEPMSKEVAYSQKFSKSHPKRTAQYSLDGKLIRIWDSTAQIRRELGLNDKYIQNVCRGNNSNTGNAYGYHWEYVDDKNGDRQINTA